MAGRNRQKDETKRINANSHRKWKTGTHLETSVCFSMNPVNLNS